MRTHALLLLTFVSQIAVSQPLHVVFDASLSMTLPAGEMTRAEIAAEYLPYILEELDSASLSLFFLHSGDTLEPGGEFETVAALRARIAAEPLYGRVSPSRALFALATRLGPQLSLSRVLLITDGEELATAHAPLPRFSQIVIARLDAGVPSALTAWLHESAATNVRLVTIPAGPPAGEDSASVGVGLPTEDKPLQSATVTNPETRNSGRFWQIFLGVIAGAAALLVAALSFWLMREHLRYRRLLARARSWNERQPELFLSVFAPGLSLSYRLDEYPASVGFGGNYSCAVPVEYASKSFSSSDRVTITRGGDGFDLESTKPLRVQGMLQTAVELREGLQVRLGTVRLVVERIEQKHERREPRPYHLERLPWLAAAILLAAAPVITATAIGPHQPTYPAVTVRHQEPVALPPPIRDGRPPELRLFDSPPIPALAAAELPAVFRDHEEIPFFDADFLAIHAHPDDESLDFGALLAALDASGRTGVQVLLTDGEGGQDLFPERFDYGRYPDYELRGGELATVRVTEAREALGWLGVEHYIRLGLQNHAYNSLYDELSPRQVLERWGGAELVVQRLASLIESYQPELLISPDGPSEVIEHFEHDAAGIAARRALAFLDSRGRNPVVSHLVSVDPLQAAPHPDLLALSAWKPVAPGQRLPRVVQLHALASHLTQLDAYVNGVETRQGLVWEYYRSRGGTVPVSVLFPELPLAPALSVR